QGGYLLITVPAFQKLFCRHDQWLGHYRRYSRKTLLRLAEQAGLTPLISGYFFSALIIPRFLSTMMESMISKDKLPTGIGQWKYGTTLGSLIRTALYWNGCLDLALSKSGLPVPGLSVYALCQK
ncbi:MAG: hypothetical protein JW795_04385, partial [Chitinivibrionales bacterium]|nr:hypothetical protein [Chitinivibrionales bacterium]